jgi:hypothetical protein
MRPCFVLTASIHGGYLSKHSPQKLTIIFVHRFQSICKKEFVIENKECNPACLVRLSNVVVCLSVHTTTNLLYGADQ